MDIVCRLCKTPIEHLEEDDLLVYDYQGKEYKKEFANCQKDNVWTSVETETGKQVNIHDIKVTHPLNPFLTAQILNIKWYHPQKTIFEDEEEKSYIDSDSFTLILKDGDTPFDHDAELNIHNNNPKFLSLCLEGRQRTLLCMYNITKVQHLVNKKMVVIEERNNNMCTVVDLLYEESGVFLPHDRGNRVDITIKTSLEETLYEECFKNY